MTVMVEKYRPNRLKDVVGESPTTIYSMVRKWQNDGGISSMPNLLFYGQPGTGKTTTAICIAKEIGCDMMEINASNDRGIDAMRKIVSTAMFRSLSGGRIIILDEADEMTPEAQAVLRRPMEKSLKSDTRFILICNDITKISDAIKSRCMIFKFMLKPSEIEDRIKQIANSEKISIDDETIKEIASASKGDMRTAIEELEKRSVIEGDKLNEIISRYL